MIKVVSLFGILGMLFLSGCASSTYKARQEQREKLASSAGLYCEWVNGDKHSDIDVELNMQMAKRCDSAKPFTLTPYKNSADQNGIMYCCAMQGAETKVAARKTNGPVAQKSSSGKDAGGAGSPAPGPQSDEIVEDK